MSNTQYHHPTYLQLRPPTSLYVGGSRDPVPDWFYLATLWPSTKLPFHQREAQRINFEAKIVRPIGSPPAGFWCGTAYGHLYSYRRCAWRGLPPNQDWGPWERVSKLTEFLKKFGLYRPPMSTARRIRAAKEFIESRPAVVVSTVWVAYSQKQCKTVEWFMPAFPRRIDGTYDPYVLTDEGELIRATAHVHDYWRLKSFPDYAGTNLRHQFTRPEIEACYGMIGEWNQPRAAKSDT